MVALLVFIMATLEIVFGRKKLLDEKGPFGDKFFKNPAGCYMDASNPFPFPLLREADFA